MMRIYPLPGEVGPVAKFLDKAEDIISLKWQKEIDTVYERLEHGEYIAFQDLAKSYSDEAEALMARVFSPALSQDKEENYTKIYVAFQMAKNYLTFYAGKLQILVSLHKDKYPTYDVSLVNLAYKEASRIQERMNTVMCFVQVEFNPKFRTPPPDHPKPPLHFSRRF